MNELTLQQVARRISKASNKQINANILLEVFKTFYKPVYTLSEIVFEYFDYISRNK